jgi:two-component sensor histidine kinase
MISAAARAVMGLLPEAVVIVTPDGRILSLNGAAQRLLGGGASPGSYLDGLLDPSGPDLRGWLRRCAGSTGTLVGALIVPDGAGAPCRFAAHGARLPGSESSVEIAIRIIDARHDRFAVLKREIAELNAQARARRHREEVLQEALKDNERLLHELNHRVKNNIQIVVSLFSMATKRTGSEEARKVLEEAQRRLLAVGAAQSLMYRSQRLQTVPARQFVEEVAEAVSAALGRGFDLDLRAGDGTFSNERAFPLALILNELITNAAKHGLKGDGGGRIAVALDREGDDFTLIVQDDGPGFPEPLPRSSGLELVRGLCRQIGAQLDLERAGGARVTIRFADPQMETLDDAVDLSFNR